MWFTPHKYKCPICDYEFEWSQSVDPIGIGKPLCHQCYKNFLISMIPQSEPIVDK